ncbi:hypothetical protein SprV_0100117600 [Sparganum proliferum]
MVVPVLAFVTLLALSSSASVVQEYKRKWSEDEQMYCDRCVKHVQTVAGLMDSPMFEPSIRRGFGILCKGSKNINCTDMLLNHLQMFTNNARIQAHSLEVCQIIGSCPKMPVLRNDGEGFVCHLCEKTIELLITEMINRVSEGNVKIVASRLCFILPEEANHLRKDCAGLIYENYESIFEFLQSKDTPKTLCTVFRACGRTGLGQVTPNPYEEYERHYNSSWK